MNKYVAAGLIEEARNGKNVVVASGSGRASQSAFLELARHAPDATAIRRSNGSQRVSYVGDIRFVNANGEGLRGMSADVLYIEPEAEGVLHRDLGATVRAVLNASADGVIIRA